MRVQCTESVNSRRKQKAKVNQLRYRSRSSEINSRVFPLQVYFLIEGPSHPSPLRSRSGRSHAMPQGTLRDVDPKETSLTPASRF